MGLFESTPKRPVACNASLSAEEAKAAREEGLRRMALTRQKMEEVKKKYSEQKLLGTYNQLEGKWVLTDTDGKPRVVCSSPGELLEKARAVPGAGLILHVGQEADPVGSISTVEPICRGCMVRQDTTPVQTFWDMEVTPAHTMSAAPRTRTLTLKANTGSVFTTIVV